MCVCVCVCLCLCLCLSVSLSVSQSVCLSTGFVPVGYTGGTMAWQFCRLTGMAMQSLGVAIRWEIARYYHPKPWHGDVMAVGDSCLPKRSLLKGSVVGDNGMVTCCQIAGYDSTRESPYLPQVRINPISTSRLFSKGPARAPWPREVPCWWPTIQQQTKTPIVETSASQPVTYFHWHGVLD